VLKWGFVFGLGFMGGGVNWLGVVG